jgi:uncharacterized phage-associated protein
MVENFGQPLINEYFEAWDYGPVIPTVYYEFREYKDNPLVGWPLLGIQKRRD